MRSYSPLVAGSTIQTQQSQQQAKDTAKATDTTKATNTATAPSTQQSQQQAKATNTNTATAPSPPQQECEHDDTTFRCVEYVRNYDGDTIVFNIPGVHPLIGKEVRVRLLDVDTAEIKTKNPCEKQKALQAKKLVEDMLKNSQRIDLENAKRGKYFRIAAKVKADEVFVGDYLVRNKLAYPYKGGKKPLVDWCSPDLSP